MVTVAVVPAGAWGTALAAVAAHNGHRVQVYSRRQDVVDALNHERQNPRSLPGVRLPRGIKATTDLDEAVDSADVVLFAPSSGGFRALARSLASSCSAGVPVVSATKGIEPDSGLRMSQVLAQELSIDADSVAVLSGPNFAAEIARRLPASTVIGGRAPGVGGLLQTVLGSSRFRVYTNEDAIGVELAGALKNILALGTGIVHGTRLGYNAEAALITRGLVEITRLGVSCGASALTFHGLAGVGDVVLTCTGSMSRNRRAGVMLGQGVPLPEVLSRMTVEGVRTTLAAHQLARSQQVEMPITAEIHSILTQGKNPYRAALSLMQREPRDETEL